MTGHRINLRADLHGHAIEYACDHDRAYFDAHPSVTQFLRPPFDHEWCCPTCAQEGQGCVPAGGRVLAVVVTKQAWGRTRLSKVDPTGPGPCSHTDEFGQPSEGLYRKLTEPGGAS